jgi:hypothetical protein
MGICEPRSSGGGSRMVMMGDLDSLKQGCECIRTQKRSGGVLGTGTMCSRVGRW